MRCISRTIDPSCCFAGAPETARRAVPRGVEHVARAVVAVAAAGSHARLHLEFVEAGAATAGMALDVAVGNTSADTNDHGQELRRP